MPPLPKKKRSKGRQGKIRSHMEFHPVALTMCPQCRTPKRSHQVCPNCGYYAGRQVITVGRKEQGQET